MSKNAYGNRRGLYDKSPLFWMMIYQVYYETWGNIRIYLMGECVLEVSSPWEYESTCPFYDGNGRVGRTIMNYYLIIHDCPPTIIYEDDKELTT